MAQRWACDECGQAPSAPRQAQAGGETLAFSELLKEPCSGAASCPLARQSPKGTLCAPRIFFSGHGDMPVCQDGVALPWAPRPRVSAGRGQDVELQPRREASTYR